MASVFRHLVPRLLGVLLLAFTPALASAPRAVAPVNSSEDAEATSPEALRESRPVAVRADRRFAPRTTTLRPPTSAHSLRPTPALRPDPFGTGLRTRLRC